MRLTRPAAGSSLRSGIPPPMVSPVAAPVPEGAPATGASLVSRRLKQVRQQQRHMTAASRGLPDGPQQPQGLCREHL